MGVCITANGSEYRLFMSYSTFNVLRRDVANYIDPKLGELYACIFERRSVSQQIDAISEFKSYALTLQNKCSKLLPFLLAPSFKGVVNYRACKELQQLLIPIDMHDDHFKYCMPTEDEWSDFLKFLGECYTHRRSMRWG